MQSVLPPFPVGVSPSLRGSGLKSRLRFPVCAVSSLPLYEGVDWNWSLRKLATLRHASPSLRGSGLKFKRACDRQRLHYVSLFTREWIEISDLQGLCPHQLASPSLRGSGLKSIWKTLCCRCWSLPLYEGVDWNINYILYHFLDFVSLFTREWIEIMLLL